MKLSRSIALSALTVAAGMVASAQADLFTFTYSDTNGVAATGNLDATWNGSVYICTSGAITITAGPGGVTTGTFALVPGSGVTANFFWDNVLQAGPSTLTTSGLLFSDGTLETNIWGNGGPNNYSLWQAPPQWAYAGEAIGTFIISPSVPTPGAAALMGVGMLASCRRRRA